MIGDVLSDGFHEIERYQESYPDMYDFLRPHIDAVKAVMDELRAYLDTPPIDGLDELALTRLNDVLGRPCIALGTERMPCKPCLRLGWCPYGALVEQSPVADEGYPKRCNVCGHECPAFSAAVGKVDDSYERRCREIEQELRTTAGQHRIGPSLGPGV